MNTSLDLTFGALSDPTRRAILSRLSRGSASVTELSRPFSLSLPAVLKHLTVLEKAGLVSGKKQGRVHQFELITGPMQDAADWIAMYEHFWRRQLSRLAKYLDETKEDTPWKESKSGSHSASGARSRRRDQQSTTHGRKRKR